SRLAESAERLRSGISIFSNQYCRETVIQTRIYEEHLAIFQAYKDGDIEKAVQMMKTHLNDSLNYALRFLPKTF
ncbi:MAG: FCD domain-containing protein, partial [Blautia sp.]|nr:FCD domain-containing protein [Blautia sp.]